MSGWTENAIIETLARLRLACEAIGVDPRDVRIYDLSVDEATRLRQLSSNDFRLLMADVLPGTIAATEHRNAVRVA